MNKIIILITLFIFTYLFNPNYIYAQNQQVPDFLNPNNINLVFGENQPDIKGLNCGIPDSEINKCCVFKKNASESATLLYKSIDDLEFFCLPPALSSAFNVAGGALSSATDFITAPFKIVSGLATGNLTAAGRALVDPFIPNELVSSVANIGKDKTCLSDATKIGVLKITGIIPFSALNKLDLPDQPCIENSIPNTSDYTSQSCKCVKDQIGIGSLCNKYIAKTDERHSCVQCAVNGGVWTGLGCIGTSIKSFTNTIFSFGIGLAGIISLFCIIYAAYLLQFSRGEPERLKKARQYLTSCILGLILIIFSVLILRIIGVDIIKIPGFG